FEIEYYNPETGSRDSSSGELSRFNEISKTFFRPFDLSKAPLLRIGVVETSHIANPDGSACDDAGEGVMLVDMHHIITDGISQGVLTTEFFAMQDGESLPPLRLRYRDYTEWQNSGKQKEQMKQQQEFWLKTFPGELPLLNLPTDYPRPLMQTFEGNNLSFKLNQGETGHLKETAKQNGTTLYIIILTTFTILLSKLSGQEDVIVGTPTAGRRHAELENTIGMFVNTLPMRNYPEGGKTVEEYLREVKENTLQAFENQEYQFEDLVERLSVRRDTGRNPIFDVLFNLLSQAEYKNPKAASTTSSDSSDSFPAVTTSKFDLTLSGFDAGDRLNFHFEYSTKLFEVDSIRRFITYFEGIVQIISNEPHQKISEIEIITEEEKRQILYEFNDADADYPRDKTIHQLFEEQVEKTPDNICTVGMVNLQHTMQISYRELNGKANLLAHLLQSKGVKTGTIAAIMLERSIEMITGLLGILKAGGAYLPIDPGYPKERINYMLADSNAG
ncbi:MAG: AMP-binding protein, partial [bacterium]|nr:AMP-binding protein [bacterium]